jgi:hypothetical protein
MTWFSCKIVEGRYSLLLLDMVVQANNPLLQPAVLLLCDETLGPIDDRETTTTSLSLGSTLIHFFVSMFYIYNFGDSINYAIAPR